MNSSRPLYQAVCSTYKFGLDPLRVGKPSIIKHVHHPGLIRYHEAGAIQELLVRRGLDSKKSPSPSPPPTPTILTFEMHPVYTCGRRERGKITDEQVSHFEDGGRAEFVETYRGGQTTFHGPGQLVAYPILDLRAFGVSPKCYVSMLEQSIIDTLKEYDIGGFVTQDTGVWVSDEEKIAAIGVHVRRNITSHGIALNVNTDMYWFDRIVACGLPDKKTTNMARCGAPNLTVAQVAATFATKLGQNLKCDVHSYK